jgi:hypothetical protein
MPPPTVSNPGRDLLPGSWPEKRMQDFLAKIGIKEDAGYKEKMTH